MWDKLYHGVTRSGNTNSFVIFSKNSIIELQKYQQLKSADYESGGLLLGYVRCNHFEVLHITAPCPKDIQSRYYFERNDVKHIKILEKFRKKSNNQICYLGEWHTHAEDYPKPSQLDIVEWDKIRTKRKYSVIFLIIGKKDYYLS